MITEQDLKKHGYTVLPSGGHIRLDPTNVPYDWRDICKDFGADPDCKEIVLAVCGVYEVYEEDEDLVHPSFDPVLRNET